MTDEITARTPLICSDERHAAKVADLEQQLAALRAVARGYCPACGRGDAAPTAQDWEQQRKRAETAEAKVADYENRITWHTTCQSCARILDSNIRETERAVTAERERDQLRATLHDVLCHFVHKGHPGEPCLSSGWISEKTVARWRATLYPPTPAATQATDTTKEQP